MPEGKVIGLMGKKGSGKSSIALKLRNDRPYDVPRFARGTWERVSFAQPLKSMCVEQFGMNADIVFNGSPEQKEQTLLHTNGKSYRQIMQDTGAFYRSVDPDYWVRQAEEHILGLMDRGVNVIFDDVRYRNEAEMIESHGGVLVRVVPRHSGYVASDDAHPSETELDTYRHDLLLFNNQDDMATTVDQLRVFIENFWPLGDK